MFEVVIAELGLVSSLTHIPSDNNTILPFQRSSFANQIHSTTAIFVSGLSRENFSKYCAI